MEDKLLCPFCEKASCWLDAEDHHHCTNCGREWWLTDDETLTGPDHEIKAD